MVADEAAVITTQEIYSLLLAIDKKVDRFAPTVERVEDHESRLRELESHGSPNAQETDREVERLRGRMHSVEGSSMMQSAFIKENVEAINKLSGTLAWLARLAVATAATVLGTIVAAFIIYAATH